MTSLTASSLPSVGILLINYNQWELTRKCVQSLLLSGDVEIVIGLIDNNSRESAPSWVFSENRVLFHRCDFNSGFISGNIQAYKMVAEENIDYVMLLNNDTEVMPDTLSLLVRQFELAPDAGLVTPVITYAENTNRIWHAGGKFIPWKMSVNQLFQTVNELPENPIEVDQVSGCAMMMKAGMFPEIGYQDAGFFIYHEDAEQSIRTIKMGLKNYLVPKARIIHHVSITVGGVLSPFAVYFTHRNRFLFARRNLKWFEMTVFTLYYFAMTLAKTLIYPVKKHGGLVRWMWLGLFHGITNRTEARPAGLFNRETE